MTRTLVVTLLSFYISTVVAQSQGSVSVVPMVGGEYPRNNEKFANLTKGSQFFQDEWVRSKLTTPGGTVYNNVEVKLNIVDDKVHFLGENGKELVIKEIISAIELQPNAKGEKYFFLNGSTLSVPGSKKGWHQVLVSDSITLLKSFSKAVVEHKSYGAPIEYSIETTEDFTVLYNNQAFTVTKPADLALVLPAKRDQIELGVKNFGKRMSREEQLVAITTYLNMVNKKT